MCVLHRCDNPPCCNPRHLFLGTVADNNADMRAKGRASGNRTRGEANHRARLTDDQVRGILSMAAAGVPQRRIAANFGTTQANVSSIVTGRTRTP